MSNISRTVQLAIHREFPGPENAKYRAAIKRTIEKTGSVDSLYRSFRHVTYGTLGLDAIRGVLRCESNK